MRFADDPDAERPVSGPYDVVWKYAFDGRVEDRAYAIWVYNAHVEHVKATCPKSRLLVFEAKQGWEPLCRFLNVASRTSRIRASTPPRTSSAATGRRKVDRTATNGALRGCDARSGSPDQVHA